MSPSFSRIVELIPSSSRLLFSYKCVPARLLNAGARPSVDLIERSDEVNGQHWNCPFWALLDEWRSGQNVDYSYHRRKPVGRDRRLACSQPRIRSVVARHWAPDGHHFTPLSLFSGKNHNLFREGLTICEAVILLGEGEILLGILLP